MFVTLGAVTLHVQRDGSESAPPLIFVNSLGSDLRIWDPLVPHFADRFALFRYDKRGHGLSDVPPGPYRIRDHSTDLERLLEHFHISGAILVGISVGGMIALDLAARRPERLAGLVLCDTGLRIGDEELWNARIQAICERGLPEVARGIMQRWFTPSFAEREPVAYQGYYGMLSRTPEAGYLGTCVAIRDADLRGELESVTHPVLVLVGALDVSTPPSLGRELADSLLDARFEVIDDAGHLPCVEQPNALATRINAFLQELGYG
jgi:3-oxoadipate enol-lactonase